MSTLGEVFTLIRNGASIKQGDSNSGIPITRIETIAKGFVNREKMGYAGITNFQKYQNYFLENGDILMSHINSVKHLGKVAHYVAKENEVIIHGMNLLSLRCDQTLLKSKYAYYYLTSDFFKRQLPNITKKSVNQASFTVTALKDLEIPLPPLEEQRRIADALDLASSLIEKRKQQIELLDTLAKSLFVEMFGDLCINSNSWDKKTLIELCKNTNGIKCGPFGTQLAKSEYRKRGIPLWGIPQINSYFKLPAKEFLTDKKALDLDSYSILPGDIAMSRKGNVGRCALYPNHFSKGIIHSDVLRIRIDNNQMNSIFLIYQLQISPVIKTEIEKVSNGAVMAGINVTKLKGIPVYTPPLLMQKQFASSIKVIEKQKTLLQNGLEILEMNYKALMQKSFDTN